MKKYLRWSNASLSVLALLLVISACTVQRSPVTGNKRAYGYTWEEEKKLGEQSDKQIQAQFGVYQDDSVQEYVDRVAQDVLANSDMRRKDTPAKYRNTEFTFRVLDSPVINAFALPGGYVYVTRGLMSNLRNEAQLAMVLGHEIAHVAARHASQSAFEQQAGQLALLGGAIGGELLGLPGGDILQIGSQATQLLFLKYSRDDESESDKLGVEYSAKTNYKASEGADFFTTLKRVSQQRGQSVPTWASTHPDPSERENRIPELAQEWENKGIQMNKVQTGQYMSEIDNMIFGMNPRQGFTRNGVFYHPELAFQFRYPENWQIQNTPSQVVMGNEEGSALMQFSIDGQNNTPRASVEQFLNQEGIQAGQGGRTSINGLDGFEATATAETQQGGNVRFLLTAMEYDGRIYRFVSYAVAERFDSVSRTFDETANSFDDLNDRSILDIQPAQLNNYQVNRDVRFSDLFNDRDLPLEITAEDVAIANQVDLNEVIEEGTWVKIPRQ